MVRKILDAISIASFTMTLMMVIGGGYLYAKRVEYMNQMMLTIQDQMVDVIQNQIKMPSVTGPAMKL